MRSKSKVKTQLNRYTVVPLKSLAMLFFVCISLSACGGGSEENSSTVGSEEKTPISNVKQWKGLADGYISIGDPATDRIELLVRIGRLLAASHVYRSRAEEFLSVRDPSLEQINTAKARVADTLNDELLNSIAAIAPVIEEKMNQSNQPFALHGLLLELREEQQIADILNADRGQRDKQLAARQKVLALYDRVHSAVLAFFPSRHEYLLASSALIREAGDKAAVAVSENGVILNVDLLKEASELIDRSTKLDPRNVSFCDSQRLPMRLHKDSINQLLDKMVPLQLGEKLNVTASDVYGLAKQAQTAGVRFPIKDSSECQ
ncbi:MAG: hypothetical protein ACJAYF_000416 [Arenicella sp.]|jgi:hypothetical protein